MKFGDLMIGQRFIHDSILCLRCVDITDSSWDESITYNAVCIAGEFAGDIKSFCMDDEVEASDEHD